MRVKVSAVSFFRRHQFTLSTSCVASLPSFSASMHVPFSSLRSSSASTRSSVRPSSSARFRQRPKEERRGASLRPAFLLEFVFLVDSKKWKFSLSHTLPKKGKDGAPSSPPHSALAAALTAAPREQQRIERRKEHRNEHAAAFGILEEGHSSSLVSSPPSEKQRRRSQQSS